jgi:hypothetical protein
VVVISPGGETAAYDLIAARRQAGRPTIADIEPHAVLAETWSPGDTVQLADAQARLATTCGSAVTGSTAVYACLRAIGVRAHALTPLLTRAQAAEFRSARGRYNQFSDPVIGWHLGSSASPRNTYKEVVAEAVVEVLEERRHLCVEAVGDPSHLPARLLTHPRVSVLPALPGGESLSRWSMLLWTPPLLANGLVEELRPFVEVSSVGVPIIFPKPIQRAIGAYLPPELLVKHPEQAGEWTAPVRSLLHDEARRSRQSREMIRRFDALYGPAASEVAVNRFLGWALQEGRSR